jgi:hypothetical protein
MINDLPADFEIEDLKDSLVTSDYFRSKENSRKILLYLFSRVRNSETASWKDIAEALMGPEALNKHFEEGTEVKAHSSARTHVKNLRRELEQAFNLDANLKHKRLAVRLPATGKDYRLEFAPRTLNLVPVFWANYLVPEAPNLALITAPRFFRTRDYFYVRHIYCNSEQPSPSIRDHLRDDGLQPSLAYLSTGEVLAAITISETFQAHGRALQIRLVSSYPDLSICAKQNLILIGSARTHPHIADLQQSFQVVLTEKAIQIRGERGGLTCELTDDMEEGCPGSEGLLDKYAVLTRFPASDNTHSITMIAANHGRAAQGVAELLTTSALLRELAARFGNNTELPKRFQVIVKVLVRREREEAQIVGSSIIDSFSS